MILDDDEEQIEPEDVENTFKTAEQNISILHNAFVQGAQYTGFILDSIHGQKEFHLELCHKANEEDDLFSYMASGVSLARNIGYEAEKYISDVEPTVLNLYNLSTATLAFNSSSASVGESADIKYDPSLKEKPPFLQTDEENITQIFEKLDPALGILYREIWQAYYGTNADNTRAAIALMRQTFDQFFDILAPNDFVRGSKYWKPKKDKDPLLVTRKERINYAIHNHVQDEIHANTLASSLNGIIKTYKVLNRFHERGIVKVESVKQAIFSMKRFLEDFAVSLDI
jgi:hypothetical protein